MAWLLRRQMPSLEMKVPILLKIKATLKNPGAGSTESTPSVVAAPDAQSGDEGAYLVENKGDLKESRRGQQSLVSHNTGLC
jgi:hypothetical protein